MGEDRRDDWRAGVDENLVSLTSAQRSTDKELDDLDLRYEALDKVIRGDPQQDTDGLIARLHNLENAVQELRAERIKFKIADETTKGIKWQVWGSIIVAILGLLGGILPNLALIRQAFQGKEVKYQPDAQLKKEIEADKRHHHKKKSVPIPSVATKEVPSDVTTESPPKNP